MAYDPPSDSSDLSFERKATIIEMRELMYEEDFSSAAHQTPSPVLDGARAIEGDVNGNGNANGNGRSVRGDNNVGRGESNVREHNGPARSLRENNVRRGNNGVHHGLAHNVEANAAPPPSNNIVQGDELNAGFVIFRDEDAVPSPPPHPRARVQAVTEAPASNSIDEELLHIRTRQSPAQAQPSRTNHSSPIAEPQYRHRAAIPQVQPRRRTAASPSPIDNDENALPSDTQSLLLQLQHIIASRRTLLDRLERLDREERSVLSALGSALHVSNRDQNDNLDLYSRQEPLQESNVVLTPHTRLPMPTARPAGTTMMPNSAVAWDRNGNANVNGNSPGHSTASRIPVPTSTSSITSSRKAGPSHIHLAASHTPAPFPATKLQQQKQKQEKNQPSFLRPTFSSERRRQPTIDTTQNVAPVSGLKLRKATPANTATTVEELRLSASASQSVTRTSFLPLPLKMGRGRGRNGGPSRDVAGRRGSGSASRSQGQGVLVREVPATATARKEKGKSEGKTERWTPATSARKILNGKGAGKNTGGLVAGMTAGTDTKSPEMTKATEGRAYAVPRTVSRKSWEF